MCFYTIVTHYSLYINHHVCEIVIIVFDTFLFRYSHPCLVKPQNSYAPVPSSIRQGTGTSDEYCTFLHTDDIQGSRRNRGK